MRPFHLALASIAALLGVDAHAAISGQASCWVSAGEHLGASPYQFNADCLAVVPDWVTPGANAGHLQAGINQDSKSVGGPASGAVASYALRGDYGDLGISTRASNAASYHERNGVREAGEGGSYANAQVSFDDGLTVRSSSLVDGQPVTIELYGRIDADAHAASSAPTRATLNHSLYAYTTLAGTGGPDASLVLCLGDSAGLAGCNRDRPGAFSLVVNTFVGAQLRLQGSMTAVTYTTSFADAANPTVDTAAWVEAIGSLHTYLRSSADVFFVAESGKDYVSAVPEPTPGAFLMAGLVALAFCRRHNRRHGPL